MWLSLSVEEDLPSFERGLASFQYEQLCHVSLVYILYIFILITKVGYAICVIDIYMGMFYNTIIGWAVYYFVAR